MYDRTPLDDEDEIVRRIGDAETVLTNKTPVSAAALERCPGCATSVCWGHRL